MNIYTKKGDKGETTLYGGTKLSKDSLRVWCYGTVDEANSILGTVYASLQFTELKQIVRTTQRNMFIVGSQLASDEEGNKKLKTKITNSDVEYLEQIIDKYTNQLGAVKNFTIPGETTTSSLFHVARTVVRRSERLVVSLSEQEYVCPVLLKYLNRLSDALYTLARVEIYESFVKKIVEKIMELQDLSSGNSSLQISTDVKNTCTSENLLYNESLISKMLKSAQEESAKLNVPISFSIADENGNICFTKRLEGAIIPSINISQNKAYTSAMFKTTTSDFGELTQPYKTLHGINIGDPKIVIFGGGFPLIEKGKVIGGIGISGGTVEEDEQIARKALQVFENFVNTSKM